MDQKLTMTRGDTATIGMKIEDLNQDLDTAFFTVRAGFDSGISFQKSLSDGITKIETGVYLVRIAPDDTKEMDAGEYYYDLEIGVNGDVFTVLRGIIVIEHDVTY